MEVVTIPLAIVDGLPAFTVSTESSFHSTPMFALMRSITSPAVMAAAPDSSLAHANGAAAARAANSRLERSAMDRRIIARQNAAGTDSLRILLTHAAPSGRCHRDGCSHPRVLRRGGYRDPADRTAAAHRTRADMDQRRDSCARLWLRAVSVAEPQMDALDAVAPGARAHRARDPALPCGGYSARAASTGSVRRGGCSLGGTSRTGRTDRRRPVRLRSARCPFMARARRRCVWKGHTRRSGTGVDSNDVPDDDARHQRPRATGRAHLAAVV